MGAYSSQTHLQLSISTQRDSYLHQFHLCPRSNHKNVAASENTCEWMIHLFVWKLMRLPIQKYPGVKVFPSPCPHLGVKKPICNNVGALNRQIAPGWHETISPNSLDEHSIPVDECPKPFQSWMEEEDTWQWPCKRGHSQVCVCIYLPRGPPWPSLLATRESLTKRIPVRPKHTADGSSPLPHTSDNWSNSWASWQSERQRVLGTLSLSHSLVKQLIQPAWKPHLLSQV